MRRTCFRLLSLILLLMAITGGTTATARPFCLTLGRECVPCGPDLDKECTYYSCSDGTMPVTCGQCSLFCFVG